ncbi:MAG: hypothetical protein MZU95_11590 [Desulfomicrobium escambiense]|nr:hypothetical protein [Desulfomicrobium escambiense]
MLGESVEKDAKDILSRILLAQIYLDEKNATKALELLEEPLKTAALSPDVASTAAQAYLLKGDIKKARGLVENALKENDQNIMLHRMMAKIHFLQGEHQKALAETDLLIKHSVGTPDILYIGALSALRSSGPGAALPYIQALKEKAPDEWITLHAQLRYHLDQNDRKNAYPIGGEGDNPLPGQRRGPRILRLPCPRSRRLAAGRRQGEDDLRRRRALQGAI